MFVTKSLHPTFKSSIELESKYTDPFTSIVLSTLNALHHTIYTQFSTAKSAGAGRLWVHDFSHFREHRVSPLDNTVSHLVNDMCQKWKLGVATRTALRRPSMDIL